MCLKPDRLEAIISLSLLCSEQKSLFPLGLLLGRIKKKKEREKKAKKEKERKKNCTFCYNAALPWGSVRLHWVSCVRALGCVAEMLFIDSDQQCLMSWHSKGSAGVTPHSFCSHPFWKKLCLGAVELLNHRHSQLFLKWRFIIKENEAF